MEKRPLNECSSISSGGGGIDVLRVLRRQTVWRLRGGRYVVTAVT